MEEVFLRHKPVAEVLDSGHCQQPEASKHGYVLTAAAHPKHVSAVGAGDSGHVSEEDSGQQRKQ